MSKTEVPRLNLVNKGLTSTLLLGAKSTLGTNSSLTNASLLAPHQNSIFNHSNSLKRKLNSENEEKCIVDPKTKLDLSNPLLKSSASLINHPALKLSSAINLLSNRNLNTAIGLTKTQSHLLDKKSYLTSSSLLSSSISTNISLINNSSLSNPADKEAKKRAREAENIAPISTEGDFGSFNILQEEYLQVESLIEFIDQQQENKRELLNQAKRFKRSNSAAFVDTSLQLTREKFTDLQRQKNLLINLVSSSLLKQPNFKDIKDVTRSRLIRVAEPIVREDPEFLLKLALYTRRELNIRVTTNFLLCLAAYSPECRPYLTRYFKGSIVLPSDWIEVAEQYQLFMDKNVSFGSLPSALRKVMVEKFPDFDAYQLAKYNKEKSRSAKNKANTDIKHTKSKLKDSEGNELGTVEEKYIKSLNDKGLQTHDRILFDVLTLEECESVKFDIIFREIVTKPGLQGNKYKPREEGTTELNETIAMRLVLDFEARRIMQKCFTNKVWSKRSEMVTNPAGFDNIKRNSSHLFNSLFIDVLPKSFAFGVKLGESTTILSRYSHSQHNVPLEKITHIRVGGSAIKLKNLTISSKKNVNLDSQMSEETDELLRQRSFTLKQLVRQLHISSPVDHVLSLLGKRYPSSFEEFLRLKMTSEYDSTKAGKRMKLPIPETWETQISMKGNHGRVWEQLIDNKKLPYMAMLRNLRNMIQCGISEKHHQWVIKKLQDEGAVVHSKQFPFRFFTAYEVLDELEKEYNEYIEFLSNGGEIPRNNRAKDKKQAKKNKKLASGDFNYDTNVLARYKTALDNALKVATTFNISPIKGSTAIFVNIDSSMFKSSTPAVKRLGKSVTSVGEIGALLALMFKYSCEKSNLVAFKQGGCFKNIGLEEGTILDNMKSLTSPKLNTGTNSSLKWVLEEIVEGREHYDNLILLSCDSDSSNYVPYLQKFLRKYRANVNGELLFVNVDLSASDCSLSEDANFDHTNDVKICGYSDSILRFVAERGNQGQLMYVENIHRSYDLTPLKRKISKDTIVAATSEVQKQTNSRQFTTIAPVPMSKWKTVKVFISSTFKDMHSERDILTKTVFPLLRAKLAPYLISVHEIDLRWGITEQEANQNQALDICLNQILDSDYFISMLGERYGNVMSNYTASLSDSQLAWLDSYPSGASITELEIECQLRKRSSLSLEDRAFFYFRNDIKCVDGAVFTEHFASENETSANRIKALKERLRREYSVEIYEDYKASFHGVKNSRALLTNLDSFAQRVFQNLFNSILKNEYEMMSDEALENEGFNLLSISYAFMNACADLFYGREKLVAKLDQIMEEDITYRRSTNATTDAAKALIDKHNSQINIVLVSGEAGCGKTTFLSFIFVRYQYDNFFYSVGAFSGSESTSTFLKIFLIHMKHYSSEGLYHTLDIDKVYASDDFEHLKVLFGEIMQSWAQSFNGERKFTLTIDGVDMLCDAHGQLDTSFSWLPKDTPSCFNFVLSARSTGQTKSILERFTSSGHLSKKVNLIGFEVGSLNIQDKADVIRGLLNNYNKRLDESAFNNQMKLLTGKRDAVNPFYLTLACEELRVHSEFETLNAKIRELPMRLSSLLVYVLERLESSYGKVYTSAVFMFLMCAKDGLYEHELYELVSLYFRVGHYKKLDQLMTNTRLQTDSCVFDKTYLPDLSQQKFQSFLQTISETFLKVRTNDQKVLCLRSMDLLDKTLAQRYARNTLNSKLTLEMASRLMSMYYWHSIDKDFARNWSRANQRAYLYLPYYLCMANCWHDLECVLTDLKFIGLKCDQNLATHLMEDFDLYESNASRLKLLNLFAVKPKKQRDPFSQKFFDYKEFIVQKYHLLARDPKCIYQEAMNEPASSQVAIDLDRLLKDGYQISGNLFEWLNKSSVSDDGQTRAIKPPMRLSDFSESVCSVSISADGGKIACGTDNCEIKLFSMSTAGLLKTFQGHSGRINGLCFVSDGSLCSVSSDGLASLWSVEGGFRIKALNKHNKHVVSDCAREPNGKSFLTVGWDCSAKIWNSANGELLGELRGHPRPINCIAFDPAGDRVATGCWDSCIRIFNTVSRTRIAVLRGHQSSVRTVSYSSSSVYIGSASIDGEVKLWNSRTGSQVANLKGHNMPVNSLVFSPKSQFLVTGSTDRRCKVWSGSVGKQIQVIENPNSVGITSVCFFQKTGEFVAAGFHSGEVKIYETANGAVVFSERVHDAFVTRLKFSGCGSYLISTANDGTGKIISFAKNTKSVVVGELVLVENQAKSSVKALAINENNAIITGSESSMLSVYDNLHTITDSFDEQFTDEYLDTNGYNRPKKQSVMKLVPNVTVPSGHKSPITACAFNQDGDKFASVAKNASIIVWSLSHINSDLTELLRINEAHADWITDVQWSNTADFLLTASNDFTLKIWNASNGKETSELKGHGANINACAYQYGCAASVCFDGSVKIWSNKGNEITTLYGHQGRVNACDLFVKVKNTQEMEKKEESDDESDDGDEEMTSLFDWGEKVDGEEWKKEHKKKKIDKHEIVVEHVYLVTVSDDATIRVWKPIESDYLTSLEKHNGRINSVALSKQEMLATASSDSSVNVWNMKELFEEVNSGKFVHKSVTSKRSHMSEVSSVCVSRQFVFSSSLDGVLMLWKLERDTNGRVKDMKFISEVQAHESTINKICLLDDSEDNIIVATCGNDKKIKVWRIDNKKQTITSYTNFVSSYPVVYICLHKPQKGQEFFVTLEANNSRIMVRVYSWNKKSGVLSQIKHGASIANFDSIVYKAQSTDSHLYVTLVENKVLKFSFDDLTTKFKGYVNYPDYVLNGSNNSNLNLATTLSKKNSSNSSSSAIWFSAVNELNGKLVAGDWKGGMFEYKDNDFVHVNSCHFSRITDIIGFDTEFSSRFLTASQDGTIKVWSHDTRQLGQFSSTSGISAVCHVAKKDGYNDFVFGDQMGYLNILRWHDQD